MNKRVQFARARLLFEQEDYEGMALILSGQEADSRVSPYGKIVIPLTSSEIENSSARNMLCELWLQSYILQDSPKIDSFTNWLTDNKTNTYGHLKEGVLVTSLMAALECNLHNALQWEKTNPRLWNILVQTLGGADLPVPNRAWRVKNQVGTNFTDRFYEFIRAQPQHVQMLQRAHLEIHGLRRVTVSALSYFAIKAYRTPTREETLAAALNPNPIFDFEQLETYCPGVASLNYAIESVELNTEQRKKMIQEFISLKLSDLVENEKLSLPNSLQC